MNRVLGDYFETLLYKIFVSIDEHTSVAEVDVLSYTPSMVHFNTGKWGLLGICQQIHKVAMWIIRAFQ